MKWRPFLLVFVPAGLLTVVPWGLFTGVFDLWGLQAVGIGALLCLAYFVQQEARRPWRPDTAWQQRAVGTWVRHAFGRACAHNLHERAARLLEEAIELAQAEGVTEAEAQTMVRYVFGRPVGDPEQEGGGVAVTLLAWAAARDVPLVDIAQREIDRVLSKPLAHFAQRNAEKRAAGIVAHPAGEG